MLLSLDNDVMKTLKRCVKFLSLIFVFSVWKCGEINPLGENADSNLPTDKKPL